MVSLWGSKYGEDTGNDSGSATPHETEPSEAGTGTGSRRYRPTREPNERTRLLIPPREHGHFLSPDDPAVSDH